jgi:hypothetical protein
MAGLFPRKTQRGKALRRVVTRFKHAQAKRRKPQHRREIEQLQADLDDWARAHPDTVFVQIGSHDGRTNDPIARHIDAQPGWRGVMVEPVPELFAKLSDLRGGEERIRLVNAAVCDTRGTITLHTVDPAPGMPKWADQLSTVHLDVLLSSESEVPGCGSAAWRSPP